MKQPDENQLRALDGISRYPEWRVVSEWMKECLQISREANDTLIDVDLYRSQGHAQAFNFVLKQGETAHDQLSDAENRRLRAGLRV